MLLNHKIPPYEIKVGTKSIFILPGKILLKKVTGDVFLKKWATSLVCVRVN
jgi:hypothetical protein